MAASRAVRHVFTGAFVNLSATISAVRALSPDEVTIVAMGHEARERCDEDDLCREVMIAALEQRERSIDNLADRLRGVPAAAKFFDPEADWAPEEDFDLCTRFDAVPFAIALISGSLGRPALVRHDLRHATPHHV